MRTDLQRTVFEFLQGRLEVPVFDDVPQPSPFPYVTIGEDVLEPDDTDDSRGVSGTVEVEIWSQHAGRKESKEIADAIYAALHQAQLTVPGYRLAAAFFESSDSFVEPDGKTRHAVETYRVLLQE